MITNFLDILAKYPEIVSEAVILRDDLDDIGYINAEHKALADIADTLYNADISPEYLKPEYKQLYDRMGAKFWTYIIKDAGAIDDQIRGDNIKYLQLQADYYNLSAQIIDDTLESIEQQG